MRVTGLMISSSLILGLSVVLSGCPPFTGPFLPPPVTFEPVPESEPVTIEPESETFTDMLLRPIRHTEEQMEKSGLGLGEYTPADDGGDRDGSGDDGGGGSGGGGGGGHAH